MLQMHNFYDLRPSLMLFPAWNIFIILLICQNPHLALFPPQRLLTTWIRLFPSPFTETSADQSWV